MMGGLWIQLKSSLWFIPAICVLFSAGLAVGLVQLDATLGLKFTGLSPQFFGLGADGSRSILATIAQSVVTIAGVSFSITIVALSLAANQYTPRVLRNYMRDHGNQVVLGGLVGIFTYCIIVLRTIQGGEESFVPAVSVIVALAFSIIAIGLFVYFVHHVATSIQAASIISSIAVETQEVVRKMFPREAEQGPPGTDSPEDNAGCVIEASKSGYLQTIEVDALSALAEKEGVLFKLVASVGDFVLHSSPLLKGSWRIQPHRDLVTKVQRCFNIQPYRTIEQDPAFGMRQIVDVAVKALSPGINDPTTAITCLNYLGSILNIIIERQTPSPCRFSRGKLCLVMRPPTFDSLVDLAFSEIRQNCRAQPVVFRAMFEVISRAVNGRALSHERRLVLTMHTRLILESAKGAVALPEDLRPIQTEAGKVLAALSQSGEGAGCAGETK